MKKIVVIGPESTGKSTLSEQLATHYKTIFVKEYAREYLENLNRNYCENDLLEIAKGQIQNEDIASKNANSILICDTDLYVIKIWSEIKYNKCDPFILNEIAKREYDLYLLTGIDMQWQFDELREHPEPEMRKYLYKYYLENMSNCKVPFVCINGTESERLQKSIEAINII